MIMADMTVQGIQALKPSSSYTKTQVSRGLYIGVGTNGDKTFFVRYTVKGRTSRSEYRLPKLFGVRTTPAYVSLTDARASAAEIQALAKQGIDYAQKLEDDAKAIAAKSAEQVAENYTVKDLFDTWFATTRRRDGGAEITRYFNRDVLPVLGTIKLRDIEEGHVRSLLEPISATGTNRKAVVLLNLLKQLFKWADGRKPWKLIVDNPTVNLRAEDITARGYEEVERDRILSEAEIKQLVRILPDAHLVKTTERAIWIVLSCCTRIGETVKAEWKHVNLDTGVWFIPEANTKGDAPEHTVYLSDFALLQFRALGAITGNSMWCFPNKDDTGHIDPKAPTKQISDRQQQFSTTKALTGRTKHSHSLELGNEKWTPHDLRRTGASLMQRVGVDSHIIERVVNHVEENRMKRIYQQFDYAEEQRTAWAKLGVLLSKMTVTSNQPDTH
jgi:integrase